MTTEADILFQCKNTPSGPATKQPAPALTNKNWVINTLNGAMSQVTGQPVVVTKTEYGKEQVMRDMSVRADEIYATINPKYVPGSGNFAGMTYDMYNAVAAQLKKEGYNPQWVDEMMNVKFQSDGVQYIAEEPEIVVTNTGAYEEALALWYKTPGTLSYAPNSQDWMAKTQVRETAHGQPSNSTEITQALVSQGYSYQVASEATEQAHQTYQYEQSVLIADQTAIDVANGNKRAEEKEAATEVCLQMLRDGKDSDQLYSYLQDQGWDYNTRVHIVEDAYTRYNIEQGKQSTGEKIGDFFGDVAEGVGDMVGSVFGGLLDGLGLGGILLIGGAVLVVIMVMKP